MKILVTNDDGYRAQGLQTLVRMMKKYGEVTVIAPKHHQSATSIAVTMGYQPIAVKDLGMIDGAHWMYLDASPASCVKFAVDNVFTDGKPDIVVSGVNHGSNASTAACYSATLGAAEEAAINGIPAFGVSLDSMRSVCDFSAVEALFPPLFDRLKSIDDRRFGSYYNINFPNLPQSEIKGVRIGHMGIGHWEKEFEDWDPEGLKARGIDFAKFNVDPDAVAPEEGESLYVITGFFVDDPRNTEGADHHLVKDGYVTVTKHNFDNTDYAGLARLKAAGLETDY